MYIIDGYNVLEVLRRGRAAFPHHHSEARKRMVDLIDVLAARRAVRAVVYFDGGPGRDDDAVLARPHVNIRYTTKQLDADGCIRRHVENDRQPGRLVVVSSDREVVGPCKGHGARVVASQDFAEELLRIHNERRHRPQLEPARVSGRHEARLQRRARESAAEAHGVKAVPATVPGVQIVRPISVRLAAVSAAPIREVSDADIDAMRRGAGDLADLAREALAQPLPTVLIRRQARA